MHRSDMVPSADVAFGRRERPPAPVATPPQSAAPDMPQPEAPPRAASGSPVLRFLDRLFLWIPTAQSPGLGAVGLFLVRQAILAPIMMMALFWALMLAFPKVNWIDGISKTPAFVPMSFVCSCVAVVLELGRYSFVRSADRPMRSLSIVTAVTIALNLLLYRSLLAMCWAIPAQLAASAAMFYGLRIRRYIAVVILAIIVGDVSVYVTAPQAFQPPATSAPASNDPPVAASPDPPAVGNMQAWAQLYPGAVVVRSRTRTMFGLTDWDVTYKVQATPEQIDSFYQSLASQQGFAAEQSFGGLHMFTRESTRDRFTYAVTTDAEGVQVIFDARSFARTGASN
jgi:hypothetical protein